MSMSREEKKKGGLESRTEAHRFLGVLEKDLCIVRNAILLLCLSTGTVDTRGSFGGVASHETTRQRMHMSLRRSAGYGSGTHPCLSRSRTFAPRSRRVCAAERPARPPPTTIACAILCMCGGEEVVVERDGCFRGEGMTGDSYTVNHGVDM